MLQFPVSLLIIHSLNGLPFESSLSPHLQSDRRIDLKSATSPWWVTVRRCLRALSQVPHTIASLSLLNSNGNADLQMAPNVRFSRQDDTEMRSWLKRVALAFLAVSVMQAGLAACCINIDDLNVGARQHSPHDPGQSQPCCTPVLAVQAIAPQSLIRWERPPLVDSRIAITPTLAARTLVAVGTPPANHRFAVRWVPDDLLTRIRVFLI